MCVGKSHHLLKWIVLFISDSGLGAGYMWGYITLLGIQAVSSPGKHLVLLFYPLWKVEARSMHVRVPNRYQAELQARARWTLWQHEGQAELNHAFSGLSRLGTNARTTSCHFSCKLQRSIVSVFCDVVDQP
jgi:hypothetical protein